MKKLILSAVLALAAGLPAASFEISATADKTKVELGEPFQVTVRLIERGRHAFPPRPQQVDFKDFDAKQAGQNSFTTIVNGDFTTEQVWVIELSPKRAGRLMVPAFVATAKDPLTGETTHSTKEIPITVVRPSGLGLGLGLGQQRPGAKASTAPLPTPEPTPEEDPAAELMPDRGLPWPLLGGALGGFGVLLGFLGWLALRRPQEAVLEAVPRDPGQVALEQLERAKAQAALGGEAAFVQELAQVVRAYLRHRLALSREATLAEAVAQALALAPGLDKAATLALRRRLELLLYAEVPAEAEDIEQGYQRARALIIGLERHHSEARARATAQAVKPGRKKRG